VRIISSESGNSVSAGSLWAVAVLAGMEGPVIQKSGGIMEKRSNQWQ
jgi:hypothetical protein